MGRGFMLLGSRKRGLAPSPRSGWHLPFAVRRRCLSPFATDHHGSRQKRGQVSVAATFLSTPHRFAPRSQSPVSRQHSAVALFRRLQEIHDLGEEPEGNPHAQRREEHVADRQIALFQGPLEGSAPRPTPARAMARQANVLAVAVPMALLARNLDAAAGAAPCRVRGLRTVPGVPAGMVAGEAEVLAAAVLMTLLMGNICAAKDTHFSTLGRIHRSPSVDPRCHPQNSS